MNLETQTDMLRFILKTKPHKALDFGTGGYRNFICLFCIWEAKNGFMAAHDEFEVLERHGCDLHVAKELRLRPDVGNLGKV